MRRVTMSGRQIILANVVGRKAAEFLQSFVKVGARAPVPLPYGGGVTFVGQFHTKKHYKTAIRSI